MGRHLARRRICSVVNGETVRTVRTTTPLEACCEIGRKLTHPRKLWYDNRQRRYEVDQEIGQVVMGIVRRDQEQYDRHAEQELLRRCVLVSIVNLLPHVQVVVGAGVEVERHAADPVEHEVRAEHVRDVGERPRRFLRDSGHDVEEDLEAHDEDWVDCPGTCITNFRISTMYLKIVLFPLLPDTSTTLRECYNTFGIDPLRVEIRQYRLIADMLQALRWFRIHQTARPAPPAALRGGFGAEAAHLRLMTTRGWRSRIAGERECTRGGTVEEYGRQLGGIVLRCQVTWCLEL